MKTILVCGARNAIWTEWSECVYGWMRWSGKAARSRGEAVHVIHGDAQGIDLIASAAARDIYGRSTRFDANWAEFKNAAGPIRNRRMFEEGKPSLGLAFGPLVKNKINGGVKLTGTGDMVSVMNAGGCSVILIPTPNVLPETW